MRRLRTDLVAFSGPTFTCTLLHILETCIWDKGSGTRDKNLSDNRSSLLDRGAGIRYHHTGNLIYVFRGDDYVPSKRYQ